MRESLTGAEFATLSAEDYLDDFSERFEHPGQSLWKLERQQEFQEPGYPVWDAFAAGRVAESVLLAEQGRHEITEYHRGLTARGTHLQRVRIVANPPTPYLWWESHILRIRAEAGERIRALDVAAIVDQESEDWTLPEVVTLGNAAMYLVQYDANGTLSGAHRYEQTDLIERWTRFITGLFDQGEPFGDYFAREIKDVPDWHISSV